MKKITDLYNKIYSARILEFGRICFYIGLVFDILIFFFDRSDWYNPYQSMMFRVSFVLFLLKCICTKYDKKQWTFIVLTALFCIFAYRINIKDEIIRAMVLIISMKDLSVKRVLKVNYLLTSLGVFILGLLAIFGILGDVIATPGYGYKADAFMVCFGLGSSNTWAIQIWLLVALFIYIYHDRLPDYIYLCILPFGVIIYGLSKCRIELLMMIITSLGGYILVKAKRFRESKLLYCLGILVSLVCVCFSIYAAKISKWWEYQTELERKFDMFLTGRITSIYPFLNGGGVLSNWKLFADPDFVEYFDMGFVRLFWWYGIIPGALAIAALIWLYIYQYKTKDYMGFLLMISCTIFTVLEAHFISPFLCRSYFLFMLGGIWYKVFYNKHNEENDKKHIAFYIGSLSKGGAERVFCNLATYFLSIGWKVTFITQYIREDEYDLPSGANRVISDIRPEECKGRLYNFFARILKLHRIIRDTNADLLMTTIGKANFMAITCSIFVRTKVVVSVVADPILEYPTKIMRILLQTLFGEADGIIMQTTTQQSFLRYGLRKISVILPNSVSPAFTRERYEGNRDKDIFMVGRMDENKNQKMAIDAFANISSKFPDAKLHLLGDGDLRQQLEAECDALNIKHNVIFHGIVNDVPDRLYKAYAFLLTSNTEGMPNTLLEAMSLGIACVSTDCPCGGPKDIIVDGQNGFLVNVNDSSQLSNILDELLDNWELTDTIGKNAYNDMLAYRSDIVNAKWRDYYLNIINN